MILSWLSVDNKQFLEFHSPGQAPNVASLLFKVAGSLQSKQNAGMSEQQQAYSFQMNVVIPHKTSQQAQARFVN